MVTISGGTITSATGWYPEGASVVYGDSATFAGTSTGQPRTWSASGNTYTDGGHYTNVYAVDQTSSDLILNGNILAAFQGFTGETAGARFGRLMLEHGLSYSIIGDTDLSVRMGPQPAATLADLFREIRDTEDGLIFDAIAAVTLVFLLRHRRYNQIPVSLDVAELPFRPAEVTDDLGVHNLVVVSNRDGGEATAEDSTSVVGTAAPPIGVGEYKQSIDVNIDDEDDLPALAVWWLRRGTVALPRYPTVTVNLAALDAARIAQIEALDIGNVLEITGYREYTIRLQIIGYKETIGWPNERAITFTCAPDLLFDAGTYNGGRRYQLRTGTTSAAYGPSTTTLTIAITQDEALSSTSAYELLIAGELIGVPAGGMGARTGTVGAYQQALIGAQRSRNGVRKTLPAGSAVRVANPGRYAR
jgi:hypothetical protein